MVEDLTTDATYMCGFTVPFSAVTLLPYSQSISHVRSCRARYLPPRVGLPLSTTEKSWFKNALCIDQGNVQGNLYHCICHRVSIYRPPYLLDIISISCVTSTPKNLNTVRFKSSSQFNYCWRWIRCGQALLSLAFFWGVFTPSLITAIKIAFRICNKNKVGNHKMLISDTAGGQPGLVSVPSHR